MTLTGGLRRWAPLIRCPGRTESNSPAAEKGGKMHMDMLAMGRGGFFAIMIIVGVLVVGYCAWFLFFKLGK